MDLKHRLMDIWADEAFTAEDIVKEVKSAEWEEFAYAFEAIALEDMDLAVVIATAMHGALK